MSDLLPFSSSTSRRIRKLVSFLELQASSAPVFPPLVDPEQTEQGRRLRKRELIYLLFSLVQIAGLRRDTLWKAVCSSSSN